MHTLCYEFIFEPQIEYDEAFVTMLEDTFEVVSIDILGDKKQIIAYSREKTNLTSPYKYTIKKLESTNWLKDYVIKFKSFKVEDFLIYGIHQKRTPNTTKIPLQIYAATAFGSNHPTTVLCIKSIYTLYKQGLKPCKILDMGCGSGILSLVAAKLWPDAKVDCADIDEESVIVTQENSKHNNIKTIKAFQSNGYQNVTGRYDLILSNILARPLIEMAPDVKTHLNKKGYIILSGFNKDQKNWVVGEYKKQNINLLKASNKQNWSAAICIN